MCEQLEKSRTVHICTAVRFRECNFHIDFIILRHPEHPTGTETETKPSRLSHNYQRGTASFVQTVKTMILLFMRCDSVYCLITLQFKLTHVVTLGIITALTEDGN